MSSNKTALEKAEDLLKKFWRENSKAPVIKAKHAELRIEPRVFVGGKLNSEIARLLVKEYLSKISMEDIARGRVIITSDRIRIRDESGKTIAEIRSKALINSMINRITNYLGKALSERQAKEGIPYIQPNKDGSYAFGDIKNGLIEFLGDMQKNDSKNLVRDAIIMIRKTNGTHVTLKKA